MSAFVPNQVHMRVPSSSSLTYSHSHTLNTLKHCVLPNCHHHHNYRHNSSTPTQWYENTPARTHYSHYKRSLLASGLCELRWREGDVDDSAETRDSARHGTGISRRRNRTSKSSLPMLSRPSKYRTTDVLVHSAVLTESNWLGMAQKYARTAHNW